MEKLRPICKFHAPIFFRALVAYWTLWYTSFMSLLYSIPLHFRGLIIICERKERVLLEWRMLHCLPLTRREQCEQWRERFNFYSIRFSFKSSNEVIHDFWWKDPKVTSFMRSSVINLWKDLRKWRISNHLSFTQIFIIAKLLKIFKNFIINVSII